MIHVDTSLAIKRLRNLRRELSRDQANRAIALAFNATLSKQRTFIGRHIRRKYPQSALKAGGYSGGKGLTISRANKRKLYATLNVSSRNVPLVFYKTKQMPDGVRVEVIKKRPHLLPFAFIRKGKAKRKHVFAKGRYAKKQGFQVRKKRIKTTGPDLPITALVGPPVNYPDPSAMFEARDNAIKDIPAQLGRFFDKISRKVIK